MKLIELETFEEVKQYAQDIIELMDLVYSTRTYSCWGKPIGLTNGFELRNLVHGVEGNAWRLSKDQYEICTIGFYNLDPTDGSWVDNGEGGYRFYNFHQKCNTTFDIGIMHRELSCYQYLKSTEITQEMYDQLEFVHTKDVVNCIILMSILDSQERQLVYYENLVHSPRELITLFQEVLCTHLSTQQITQIKS
jgi:hypothetical protein